MKVDFSVQLVLKILNSWAKTFSSGSKTAKTKCASLKFLEIMQAVFVNLRWPQSPGIPLWHKDRVHEDKHFFLTEFTGR